MGLHLRVFCVCITKSFKHFNLSSNREVLFVRFAFYYSRWKTVKGSKIFEIKAGQNHTFRNLFDVFSELQNILHSDKKTLFLLFCMEKTQSALIVTSEKLAIFNEDFCYCDLW